jgi:signal transduction histidine kinase
MLTKYTKENIENTFISCSLDSILLETINKYNKQLKDKNIKLHLKKFESVTLDGNALLLGTIFSNLIDNAIKYTPKDKNIFISLYMKKENIYFIIEDEGIGIDKEQLEKVMNRFYRVEESRNKKIKGFGLGLSIVKNSVELHNAKINIDSKKDFGTKIEIIF